MFGGIFMSRGRKQSRGRKLYDASKAGDIAKLRELLREASREDLEYKDKSGRSYKVACRGYDEIEGLHELGIGDSPESLREWLNAPVQAHTAPLLTTTTSAPKPVKEVKEDASPKATPLLDFTAREHTSMTAFLQHSTALLHESARLQQVMRTVAAHDRTLQMLVSKEKECPSLFWFYPKKPELRRWLSNPAKCLFQDTLMMVVVCPVTLCVVECGPNGVGWEVNKPKEWVKKWGPAILFSIYVMQAAALAGRVVGIPLPPVLSAVDMREALGLDSMFSDAFRKGINQANLSDSLAALRDITAAELQQTTEMRTLCSALQSHTTGDNGFVASLSAGVPMHMVGEAYKSIHTFLTTGKHAELGKLEDQLRGRMERVMAPDGDIEWVSVQGRDAWLEKHSAVVGCKAPRTSSPTSPDIPCVEVPVPTPVFPANSNENLTWLGERLIAAGITAALVELCDRVLVRGEGFSSEKVFSCASCNDFHIAYLTSIGINAKGLQLVLLELHKELRREAGLLLPSNNASDAQPFTTEDRKLLQKLKLQLRGQDSVVNHGWNLGNKKVVATNVLSEEEREDALRQVRDLESRLSKTESAVADVAAEAAMLFEGVNRRIDEIVVPAPNRGGGCCALS